MSQSLRSLVAGPGIWESNKQSSGLLISKVVSEVNYVTSAATTVIASLVRDTLVVIGLLIWLLILNWQLTLVVLVLVPVIALVTRLIGRRIRKVSRDTMLSTGDLTRLTEEAISAHKVIKVFGGQDVERQRFDQVNQTIRRQSMKLTIAGAMNVPTTQLASAIAVAIIVTIALMQSVQQETTVGGFVSFVTALLMLLSP